jgi:hypothetical protein
MHPFASISPIMRKFSRNLRGLFAKFQTWKDKEGIQRSIVSDNPI